VRYSTYTKQLPVAAGELSSYAIDEALSLSFVFKFCRVHLVEAAPDAAAAPSAAESKAQWVAERAGAEKEGATCRSTVLSVKAGKTYFAIVEEDVKEAAAADAKTAADMAEFLEKQKAAAEGGGEAGAKDSGSRPEGCSCIYVRAGGLRLAVDL
jgi:hypothetical protein